MTTNEEWTPPVVTTRVLRHDVEAAKRAWSVCLAHHGAARALFPWEEIDVARALQSFGREAVLLAILGAQHEPETEDYKPSRYLNLRRLFDPAKVQRFISLGAQVRQIEANETKRTAELEARNQAFQEGISLEDYRNRMMTK